MNDARREGGRKEWGWGREGRLNRNRGKEREGKVRWVFHVCTIISIVHYKVQFSLLGLLEVIIYSTLSPIQEGSWGGVIVRKRE